jgi:hypothetical protein
MWLATWHARGWWAGAKQQDQEREAMTMTVNFGALEWIYRVTLHYEYIHILLIYSIALWNSWKRHDLVKWESFLWWSQNATMPPTAISLEFRLNPLVSFSDHSKYRSVTSLGWLCIENMKMNPLQIARTGASSSTHARGCSSRKGHDVSVLSSFMYRRVISSHFI